MRANETSRTHHSGSLARAFRIAGEVWHSPIRWQIGGLLVVVIVLTVGTVWLQVQLNTWQGAFYNALQGKNQADFLHLLMRFLRARRGLHRGCRVSPVSAADVADPLAHATDRALAHALARQARALSDATRRQGRGQPRPAHRRGCRDVRLFLARPDSRFHQRPAYPAVVHRNLVGAVRPDLARCCRTQVELSRVSRLDRLCLCGGGKRPRILSGIR